MKKLLWLLCLWLILLPLVSCSQTANGPAGTPETETPASTGDLPNETAEPTKTPVPTDVETAEPSSPSTKEEEDLRVRTAHEGDVLSVDLFFEGKANAEVSLILLSDKNAIDTWTEADADKPIDLRQVTLDASGAGSASMYLPKDKTAYLFVTLGNERIVKEVG